MTLRRNDVLRAGSSLTFIIAVGFLSLTFGQPTKADDFSAKRCTNGADIRLVEVRFANPEGDLPCKVIYRPAIESNTVGIVSWQGIDSLEACKARVDEVINRLTSEGWDCTAQQNQIDAAISQTDADEGDEGEAIAPPPDFAIENKEASLGAAPLLPRDVEQSPSPSSPFDAPAEVPVDVPDEIPIKEDGGRTNEFDETARFVDNLGLPAPTDDLVDMIEDDLAGLDTTLDGRLVARIAGYGDLNDDAIEDALVLYTFTSPQPAYRQFLMAYIFDGETYQLTAVKPISGNVSATKSARIEMIEGGVIHIKLQAFEPGDVSCCPSGTRDLALVLRELELIDIDANVPSR